MGEELRRGPGFHHHAVFHKDHLVGHVAGKAHLVGDDQHGHALVGQRAHDGQHFAGEFGVQRRGGFVEVDDGGAGGDGPGNGHPLLLPARKLAGVGVPAVQQAHLLKRLLPQGHGPGAGHPAAHDQPLGHVLQSGPVAEQVVVLEHEGGLFPQPRHVLFADARQVESLAVQRQRAAVGPFQKIDAPQQGGLAGTAGAQDGHHVAFVHLQVHALEHVLPVKRFADVFCFQ